MAADVRRPARKCAGPRLAPCAQGRASPPQVLCAGCDPALGCRRAAPRRQLFRFTPANPGRQYPKKLVPLEEWLQKMKRVHQGSDTYIEASALELEDPPGTQGIWD